MRRSPLESILEAQQSAGESIEGAKRAYTSAMIAVHAQQTVVSSLLDILGYIPEMPRIKPH